MWYLTHHSMGGTLVARGTDLSPLATNFFSLRGHTHVQHTTHDNRTRLPASSPSLRYVAQCT